MLRLVKQELRRLLPQLLVCFVLMSVVASILGYLQYQRVEQTRPDRDLAVILQSITYLEQRLVEPEVSLTEKRSIQEVLATEQKQRAWLLAKMAASAPNREQLESDAVALETRWLRGSLSTSEHRQWQLYRYLLLHDQLAEPSWTMNIGVLLMDTVTALPYLLVLPAIMSGLQLAFAASPKNSSPVRTAISRIIACALGLLSLSIAIMLLMGAVGSLIFGGGGFAYPVALNSLLREGTHNFVFVARWQAMLLLIFHSVCAGLVAASLAAATGLLLGNWLLGIVLLGGVTLAGWELGWLVTPLVVLNSNLLWLVESSRGRMATQLVWIAVWGIAGATFSWLLFLRRAAQNSWARSGQGRDWLRRAFRSVRWRFILLFFLSGALAVATVFVALGTAMTLYRFGLFQDLFTGLYNLAGLPITVGFGLSLFVLFFFILTGRTTLYLEEISEAVGQIASGDLSVQIPQRFRDELGDLAGNINSMADQLTRGREEERRAEQAKTELITSISHDLRTPLTSVLGYLELIEQSEPEGNGELQKYAEIARQKALRLQKLIDGLFEYTRLAYGGLKVQFSPISLNQLLRQLAEEFVPILQQANMLAELQLPDNPLQVNADGDLLVRVFDNLCANAVRYGQTAGRLQLSLTAHDEWAEVRVINFGPPIPEEDLPHIFERFYRVDKSRNEQGGGAGLGLAIAKQIVELHHGTLGVTSTSEKTEFIVRLPLAKTEQQSDLPAERASLAAGGRFLSRTGNLRKD